MARFLKYAFPDEATFTALPVPQGFAVPLGEIDGAYCVDILWDAEPDTCLPALRVLAFSNRRAYLFGLG